MPILVRRPAPSIMLLPWLLIAFAAEVTAHRPEERHFGQPVSLSVTGSAAAHEERSAGSASKAQAHGGMTAHSQDVVEDPTIADAMAAVIPHGSSMAPLTAVSRLDTSLLGLGSQAAGAIPCKGCGLPSAFRQMLLKSMRAMGGAAAGADGADIGDKLPASAAAAAPVSAIVPAVKMVLPASMQNVVHIEVLPSESFGEKGLVTSSSHTLPAVDDEHPADENLEHASVDAGDTHAIIAQGAAKVRRGDNVGATSTECNDELAKVQELEALLATGPATFDAWKASSDKGRLQECLGSEDIDCQNGTNETCLLRLADCTAEQHGRWAATRQEQAMSICRNDTQLLTCVVQIELPNSQYSYNDCLPQACTEPDEMPKYQGRVAEERCPNGADECFVSVVCGPAKSLARIAARVEVLLAWAAFLCTCASSW